MVTKRIWSEGQINSRPKYAPLVEQQYERTPGGPMPTAPAPENPRSAPQPAKLPMPTPDDPQQPKLPMEQQPQTEEQPVEGEEQQVPEGEEQPVEGEEQPSAFIDLGKQFYLKKIYSKLITISRVLDRFTDPIYNELKDTVYDGLEYFGFITDNFEKLTPEESDELVGHYEKLLKQVSSEFERLTKNQKSKQEEK